MKKTLSLLLVLTAIIGNNTLFAAELPQLHNPQEAVTLLGYDPSITLLQETDPLVVNSGRKTVYFHGFGGNKDAASLVRRFYGAERLPGDIITFDFADANNGNGMDTSKSSLGQWSDVKTALYVLKKLHDTGETEIGITAHSRGGATAVNVIAVLADTEGKHTTRLSELGIDQAKQTAMLAMVRNIVLECPLVSLRSVIKHHIEQTSASSLGKWFTNIFSPSIRVSAVSADYAAPTILKQYRPWAEHAIESAALWNGANIPTMVHFQTKDEVLGNELDETFYEKLQASNGDTHTYFHKGDDGGHNSSFESFARERNLFLKLYSASHWPYGKSSQN
ncbi:MAG: hypothetical protein M1114_02990 [Candidatus Dependentiae bacterium]|nr:hypothetical protein [Candidatus Dependentiae bacterium]